MRAFGPAAVAAAFMFSSVILSAGAALSQQQSSPLGLTIKPAAGGVERAEIVGVATGSVAEAAGLKAGDVLLYAAAADGERISLSTQDALDRWATAQQPGSTQTVSYVRGEQILTANIVLGPVQTAAAPPTSAEPTSVRLLGLAVKQGSDGNSAEVIDVKPGSAAATAGLQVGDVLLSGQTGTANADSLVSQETLDAFITKSAGQTRDVVYTRNKQFLTAKLAVPAQTAAAVPGHSLLQSAPSGPAIGLGITVKTDQFALSLTPVGYITAVVSGSDADKAGLRVGDSIREVIYGNVGGSPISSQLGADFFAFSTPPGTVAQFRVKRDGQELMIPVLMTSPTASTAFVGMDVRDSSDDPYAVEVIKVLPGSPAEAAGVQAGDQIKPNSFSVLGARGLHMLLVEYRNDWITINILRDGKRTSSRLTISKDPIYTAATVLTADAGQSSGDAPSTQAAGVASASAQVVPQVPAGADPFARTITTLNGRGTQVPPFKLRAGQVLEAQISANGAPLVSKLCYVEDDVWNVDPERCYENINISSQSAVRYRHVAKEPEVVTLSVASTDASAGSYTVATRNGNRPAEGTAALAVLEGLAGKPYIIDAVDQGLAVKAAVRYVVDEQGKRGRLRYQFQSGTAAEFTYALDNNGQLTWVSPTSNGIVYLGIDGLLYQQAGDTLTARGRSAAGEFLVVPERRLVHGGNAEQMHVGVFGRSQRLGVAPPATDEQVTTMMLDGPSQLAQAQQRRAEDWAALGQMAGRFFYFINGQYENVASFQWETPGEVLVARHWAADEIGTTPNPLRRMTYNPALRTITTEITHANGSTARSTFKRGPNGESIETQADGGTWVLAGAGNEWTTVYTGANKQQTKANYRPMDDNTLKIFADRTQAKQARLAQERAQAAAQQAEESSIGLFDVLNFATTVQSAMSSPEAYMAAMSQAAPELATIVNGVAAAQSGGNPLAAAGGFGGGNPLGAIPGGVNPYTGLGGGAGGLGGMGGGPTGVRGTYPTRPNLAEGPQCPGFTISNYRTHAYQGGNDQQLYSHCGVAFEYYKMYLNAINEGYGEADANRTYNAHEGAVRVLNSM